MSGAFFASGGHFAACRSLRFTSPFDTVTIQNLPLSPKKVSTSVDSVQQDRSLASPPSLQKNASLSDKYKFTLLTFYPSSCSIDLRHGARERAGREFHGHGGLPEPLRL
jgi:hypothetical protein